MGQLVFIPRKSIALPFRCSLEFVVPLDCVDFILLHTSHDALSTSAAFAVMCLSTLKVLNVLKLTVAQHARIFSDN